MKKTLLVLAAVLMLSVLGLGNRHISAQDSPDQPTFTATPTQAPIDLGGIRLENRASHETFDKPKLTVDVSKPVLTGATDPAVDKFNKAVDQIIEATAGQFKKDTLSATQDPNLPPEIADLGSYIDVSYEVPTASSRLISIKFNVGWYGAGAAHPNSYSVTLNYDLKAGKVLKLADLFKPGAKYLEALSKYSVKTLKAAERLDFPEGADPKEENYRSWNITKNGLQINFDDYQVTPHAAGPQTVVVPYTELKDIIRPDGPLGAVGG
jgi:hypothetical protein